MRDKNKCMIFDTIHYGNVKFAQRKKLNLILDFHSTSKSNTNIYLYLILILLVYVYLLFNIIYIYSLESLLGFICDWNTNAKHSFASQTGNLFKILDVICCNET